MRYALLLVISLLLAACGTRGPVYPDPTPDQAQLVVQLHGEAREGVRRPTRRTVREGYTTRLVTDEDGAAFERVDYSRIEDVVVLLTPSSLVQRRFDRNDESIQAPPEETLDIEFTKAGFSRMQYLGERASRLRVQNRRPEDITIFGHSDYGDECFFEQTISAGGSGVIDLFSDTLPVLEYKVLRLYCEQDESAQARLFVTGPGVSGWIGSSNEEAYFAYVADMPHEVSVYAPRLPKWSDSVKPEYGTRTTVKAELSVNRLAD